MGKVAVTIDKILWDRMVEEMEVVISTHEEAYGIDDTHVVAAWRQLEEAKESVKAVESSPVPARQ